MGERLKQDRAGDDQKIAKHDQEHQPDRHVAHVAQRNINAHEKHLVGQRVEIGADLADHPEPLGEDPVHRIRDTGGGEQPEGISVLTFQDQVDGHPVARVNCAVVFTLLMNSGFILSDWVSVYIAAYFSATAPPDRPEAERTPEPRSPPR